MDGIVVDEKRRVEEDDDVGDRGSRRRAIEDGLGRKTRDEKAAAGAVLSNIKQQRMNLVMIGKEIVCSWGRGLLVIYLLLDSEVDSIVQKKR